MTGAAATKSTTIPMPPSHFVYLCQDVTERKVLEERLSYQAFHDPLTGLANRALFTNRLERVG